MNNLDQFFLMKVSGREHTSFHYGDIMHPLVEYSLGSDLITIVALTAILVVENPGEYTQAFAEIMRDTFLLQFFSPPHLTLLTRL